MEKKVKKRRSMPTAYSILLLLIAAIALLSHGIPGVKGASFADVVMAIPSGFLDAIDVCLFILILGGFLGLTGGTGALEAGIAHVVRRFQGREMILIPILMFLFSIGGTTYGMAEETMAFGDNYNDVPMLDAVGHPYIMASAAESLRQRYANRCTRPEDVMEKL